MLPTDRSVSCEQVRQAMGRLRVRGRALRERPRGELLDVLCELLEVWRDPDSRWRRALERDLPGATGFSAPVVRTGLRIGLEHWSGEAFRRVVAAETSMAGPASSARLSGFALTGVVLAGSIPMPTLLQLMLPLLLGSPVLAKPASRDRLTARLVADSLRELDEDLGSCLEVIDFGRDEACTRALLEAECLVATGDDDTLSALTARAPATSRLIRYGHRLSVAVLGHSCTRGGRLAQTCRDLALDVALWDQQGCLSPLAIYVDGGAAAAARVASALADALSAIEQELPAGEIPAGAAAELAGERAEAELRAAAGRAVEIRMGAALCWTVVLEEDARFRRCPLHRFVRVHPLAGLGELRAALGPLSAHLAAVALDGFEDRSVPDALAALGASRICAPGRLQAPPLSWHHDGRPLLLPLARICDLEPRETEPAPRDSGDVPN